MIKTTIRIKVAAVTCGVVMVLMACSSAPQRPDFRAAHAAKEYYDSLLAGNADWFVRGTLLPDTIPDSYREQLCANARMLLGRLRDEHGGLLRVDVINCVNDSTRPAANAFLLFTFADSLKEEVVVPMEERNGRWLMR